MRTTYKARSLKGAERRVRELLKIQAEYERYVGRMSQEIKLLARLAAKGPAFDNPLIVAAAEKIRDRELALMNMNPDGSYKR